MSEPSDRERDRDEIVELESEILLFMDTTGLTYIDVDTLVYNLEADAEDVRTAVENLEQLGELKSEPVRYERREAAE